MAISTNSIIHYTSSYSVLTSILREGFRVKYCAEILELRNTSSRAAHPIISFCDIPLSDSTQHFAAYGRYGIGLSKAWAIANGVNPVIYVDKNSLFALCIQELILERRKTNTNLTQKQKNEILRIKSYAKNYSGTLKRKSINKANYRFYDEREWRFVPGKDILKGATFSVNIADYEKSKDAYNQKLSGFRIKFEPKDISYIILKETAQIPAMTNFLRSTYSSSCTADELDILLSKICSTEQIIDDY
jgi:hypothetical protein